MKMINALLLSGILGSVCLAQTDTLPGGGFSTSLEQIFKEDATIIKERIIRNLKLLEGVEIDSKTGEPKMEIRKLPPVGGITKQLDRESIIVWWMTPKLPPLKSPLKHRLPIKAIRAEILITVECLKTNPHACFVGLQRGWAFNLWYVIPYTEFPLWRGNDIGYLGHLPSDVEWIHKIAPEKEFMPLFVGGETWKIRDILKTMPSGN